MRHFFNFINMQVKKTERKYLKNRVYYGRILIGGTVLCT